MIDRKTFADLDWSEKDDLRLEAFYQGLRNILEDAIYDETFWETLRGPGIYTFGDLFYDFAGGTMWEDVFMDGIEIALDGEVPDEDLEEEVSEALDLGWDVVGYLAPSQVMWRVLTEEDKKWIEENHIEDFI